MKSCGSMETMRKALNTLFGSQKSYHVTIFCSKSPLGPWMHFSYRTMFQGTVTFPSHQKSLLDSQVAELGMKGPEGHWGLNLWSFMGQCDRLGRWQRLCHILPPFGRTWQPLSGEREEGLWELGLGGGAKVSPWKQRRKAPCERGKEETGNLH